MTIYNLAEEIFSSSSTHLTFTLDQGPQSMLRSCAGWNCISTIASFIFVLMETVAPPVCLLCHVDYSHMYILWSWIGFVSQGAGLPKTISFQTTDQFQSD